MSRLSTSTTSATGMSTTVAASSDQHDGDRRQGQQQGHGPAQGAA